MKYYSPEIISLEEIDEKINKYGVEFAVSGPAVVEAALF